MRKSGRLQIRISEELRRWAVGYAREHHTTVSELITRFFVRLRSEDEQRKNPVDAEQV